MSSDRVKNLSKFFIVPQRYILGIMGSLATVNAYTMRICLSVAITEMVTPVNKTINIPDFSCPVDEAKKIETVTDLDKRYDWSENIQGLVLGSFYYGYLVTHLPGGVLSENFGGKHVLGFGLLLTALVTFLTPPITYWTKGDWGVIMALRIIIGLGQGVLFPALNAMLGQWIPKKEKSLIGTLTFSGAQIGTIISHVISGAIIDATEDWAAVFYLFASLGTLWWIIWVLICYSSPGTHPFISDKEKEYLLDEELKAHVSFQKKKIPWKSILTSVPLWALITVQWGHDWGWFAIVTYLPKYMKDVLHVNVKENGYLSSLPYLLMWIIAMCSGYFCDWLLIKNYLSVTATRKIFATIGSMGPALFIVLASYSGCDKLIAIAMFTIGMGLMGTFFCGVKINALDLAPNFGGTLMALVNGAGVTAGMMAPSIIGLLTPDRSLLEWRIVFWITFVVLGITNAIFVVFGSGEEQEWNKLSPPAPEQE